MTQPNFGMLKRIAAQLRKEDIQSIATAGSGHPGGSLSIIDVLTVLYFGKILHYDPKDPHWEDRDRLVLSKGHTCPALYCALAYAGFFPKQELATLRKFGSRLQGHTDLNMKTPGVETCGGPLGQGLSVALGMAIGLKMNGKKSRVYTIIGDGESAKGGITEAAKCAGVMKMNNMITFLDYNKVDQDGAVKNVLPCRFEEEWSGYGWEVIRVNGRDLEGIYAAINSALALQEKHALPVLIILDTIKGAGISFMAAAAEKGDASWHGAAPKGNDATNALAECDALLAKLAKEYSGSMDEYLDSVRWTAAEKHAYTVPFQEKINPAPAIILFEQPAATRNALGKYIAALGKADSRIVTVTAGVAGSVKFEDFAKQFGTFSATNRSGRFVQVGIAEANMAGVAAGLGLVGKKPWMATFDIFVKECLGVIRNSICYSDVDVKIVGTHAGLGVEWDGGSHQSTIVPGIMADLFRMESYEPADCNETQELMKLMYEQNKAAYFRLTRQKLPLYSSCSYHYGSGARVVKDAVKNVAHGVPSVVLLGSAAGLDLAMQAALQLEKNGVAEGVADGVAVRVIDVYSLSHLNTDGFRKLIPANVLVATVHDAHHKLLAREIAYSLSQIGQGNKIISFGMQEFGETGCLADLYKKHGMDVDSIVKKVKENLSF